MTVEISLMMNPFTIVWVSEMLLMSLNVTTDCLLYSRVECLLSSMSGVMVAAKEHSCKTMFFILSGNMKQNTFQPHAHFLLASDG